MTIVSDRVWTLMLEQSQQNNRLVPKAAPGEAPPIEAKAEFSAKEQFSNSFYTKEEEPWKGRYYEVTDQAKDNQTFVRPMTKEDYLIDLYLGAQTQAEILYSRYDKFMAQLNQFHPELAMKNFSYTLGDDAEIKILDPTGNLSFEEIESIKEAMNGFNYLKEAVQDHAKTMMAIVDHDTEFFGGKVKLNLMNFQTTVDYAKLRKAGPESFVKACMEQILEHGEEREDRLIDIRA
jgi:hypothetical protein